MIKTANLSLTNALTEGYDAGVDRRNALVQQERANKLADLQYQSAVDAVNKNRALQSFRANKNPQDKDYYAGLRMIDPALAMQEEESLGKIAETRAKTQSSEFDLQNKRLDFTLQAVGAASTPEKAIYHITQGVKNGVFSMQEASNEIAQLSNITPEGYAQYRMNALQRTLAAKDQLDVIAPKIDQMDTGSSFVATQANRFQPGYGRPMPGMAPTPKTATISERTAQGNLALAQKKFKFEQDNPGFELKENADGEFYAIDKRTKKATLITIDDGAPMAPASNAFSPRLPPTATPAVTQVIPGMPSVLDQRAPVAPVVAAPATPMAGTPLRGKGTAMTQEQQKSAMFGASMLQAQNVIQDVASRGTYKGAIVPGVLEGLVKLAPFGVGDAAANAIESTFRTDPTGLIGPDVDQQKLAQAQVAFATAYLRSTSGAAFGASEVANTIKEFFPLRGEGDSVIKQKEEARDRAVEGMAMGSTREGRVYMDKYRKPNATNVITNPQFPGFSVGGR